MSEPFLGEIRMFGTSFNPRGWLNCDGQLLPISQYDALFSLFGTMYGGDGRTTFGLPELRGRVPIHVGQGPGLPDFRQGSKGGTPNVTLNVNEIPSHFHTVSCSSEDGETDEPVGNVHAKAGGGETIYAGSADETMENTGNTGGNREHNNMQPYQVIRYCVAVQGVYPSRN